MQHFQPDEILGHLKAPDVGLQLLDVIVVPLSSAALRQRVH